MFGHPVIAYFSLKFIEGKCFLPRISEDGGSPKRVNTCFKKYVYRYERSNIYLFIYNMVCNVMERINIIRGMFSVFFRVECMRIRLLIF